MYFFLIVSNSPIAFEVKILLIICSHNIDGVRVKKQLHAQIYYWRPLAISDRSGRYRGLSKSGSP